MSCQIFIQSPIDIYFISYSRIAGDYTAKANIAVNIFGTVLVPGALFRKWLHIILLFCT